MKVPYIYLLVDTKSKSISIVNSRLVNGFSSDRLDQVGPFLIQTNNEFIPIIEATY